MQLCRAQIELHYVRETRTEFSVLHASLNLDRKLNVQYESSLSRDYVEIAAILCQKEFKYLLFYSVDSSMYLCLICSCYDMYL